MFADWNIPLHIGGVSDPFQPIEAKQRRTYKAMEVLRDSEYPYIISTKGRLVADPEYLELFDESNAVVQLSMACSKYDRIEPGCPTFSERLEIAKQVAPHTKRLIIRAQPYLHEIKEDLLENIPLFADAGAYGIIVEGMKFIKKKPGMVRVGGDTVYPQEILRYDFEQIKDKAHENGLVFLCGENRLRWMGDSLTCCGVEGLEGFEPNKYNLCHLLNGDEQAPREGMTINGSAYCFKSLYQNAVGSNRVIGSSFVQEMGYLLKNKRDYVKSVLGK